MPAFTPPAIKSLALMITLEAMLFIIFGMVAASGRLRSRIPAALFLLFMIDFEMMGSPTDNYFLSSLFYSFGGFALGVFRGEWLRKNSTLMCSLLMMLAAVILMSEEWGHFMRSMPFILITGTLFAAPASAAIIWAKKSGMEYRRKIAYGCLLFFCIAAYTNPFAPSMLAEKAIPSNVVQHMSNYDPVGIAALAIMMLVGASLSSGRIPKSGMELLLSVHACFMFVSLAFFYCFSWVSSYSQYLIELNAMTAVAAVWVFTKAGTYMNEQIS